MVKLLAVPIHLDALYLPEGRYVTSPMADFTRLPYFDGELGRDINPETPYLSEAILSQPFQDQQLRLKAGIHLHWALPDALTRASHQNDATIFPAVPNRWLVTRSRGGSKEKQWVVESDFLSAETPGSVNYPYIAGEMPTVQSGVPFRYLGRNLPFEVWQPTTGDGSYLKSLTAVGYGEPTFAAFYPNCHSVFGFYDGDYSGQAPSADLRYDVVGWYDSQDSDELYQQSQGWASGNWLSSMEESFGWTVDNADGSGLAPQRMVCYAQITFASSSDTSHPNLASDTGVSVGNTATEALAAHLGSLNIVGRSQDDLEDLLEALQLADNLEQQSLDVGPKFKEGRHTSTFRALTPGKLWTVRRSGDNSGGADVAQAQEEADLPAGLAAALDGLNSLQSDYDRAGQELEDRRTQTFADWYKYMVCVYPPETSRESYPDIDEVKFFIEEKDIKPLQNLQARTGTFEVDDSGNVIEPQDAGDTLAHQLKEALETVKQLLASNAEADLVLQPLAPPRYYLPSEPVVLITGDAATPSDRHGQDGELECLVTEIAESDLGSKQTVETAREQIVSLFASLSESIGINVWQHQPWHPILLQWEVEFFPTRDGNNLDHSDRTYDPQFMQENYQLAEKDVELRIKPEKIPPEKAANVYSGTTILSPAARPVLSERILIYLEKHLLGDYYEAQNIAEDQQTADYFQTYRDEILEWYKTGGSDEKFKQLIYVYEHLQAHSGSNLCQSLSGFNDALLMHKVTRQTPIADPIGFEPYKTFTEGDVSEVVGQNGIKAPQPLNDFNPIRAGSLKLLGLRLIDNFGIVHDVNVDGMTTTQQLRLEGHPDWVAMLPRLAQPARIDFRWLDADHDQKTRETNSHPETTPICGWLLPNNLDDSLAVYDRDGSALGSLYALADSQNSALAQWRSAPGLETEVAIADLANEHLRKAIEYIQARGAEFVGNFLEAIDSALAGIDPESATQHRSLALLMGRPVAVVRAKVDLQLLGLPAYNQGWNVFRQDMGRSRRETDGFTGVEFPIRIGEYHQLNDGLVGYWLEDEAFQIQSPFYAAQSEANDDDDIITYDGDGDPIAIKQTIDSPPQYLTMLVDPRGVVHATSGILPTKAISIPAEQYGDALRHIEVTFFSAPILSEAGQLDLPLPKEAGFLWSWLQKENNNWTELSTLQTIRRSVFVAAMGMEGDEGNALWENLVQQGWLSSLDEETALVVAGDRRPDLTGDLATQQEQIEKALDSPTVDPAQLEAHFLSEATVREGWLKLRKAPSSS